MNDIAWVALIVTVVPIVAFILFYRSYYWFGLGGDLQTKPRKHRCHTPSRLFPVGTTWKCYECGRFYTLTKDYGKKEWRF